MTVQNLEPAQFVAFINKPGIRVVYFWAPWCKPCVNLMTSYELLSEKYPDAKFGKLSVDSGAIMAKNLKVTTIPTFLIYKNGELREKVEVKKDIGEVSKKIEALFDLRV